MACLIASTARRCDQGESVVPTTKNYSLTENLTLLAEFTDTKAEAHNGVENDSSNFNIGGYLSF